MVAEVVTKDKVARRPGFGAGGGNGNGFHDNGGGGDNDGQRPRLSPAAYRQGMWFALGSVVMLFAAFSSALIIRTISNDWQPLSVPSALWASTAILFASSVTLEVARRALRRADDGAFKQWLSITTLLGGLFVGGQLLAWKQLMNKGIYLSTNPHHSFFYLLTSLHGLHLLGGLLALGYIFIGAIRNRFTPERHVSVDVAAIYWHFMDGLWIYLFILLFIWR
jgi:cytochrome c oxidase subunit 3